MSEILRSVGPPQAEALVSALPEWEKFKRAGYRTVMAQIKIMRRTESPKP